MDQFAHQSEASDREFSNPEILEESIQHGDRELSNQQAARSASARFQLLEDILDRTMRSAVPRFTGFAVRDAVPRYTGSSVPGAVPNFRGFSVRLSEQDMMSNRMLHHPLMPVNRDQHTDTTVHRRVRRNHEHRRRVQQQFLQPSRECRQEQRNRDNDVGHEQMQWLQLTDDSGRSLLPSSTALPRSIGSSSLGGQEAAMVASEAGQDGTSNGTDEDLMPAGTPPH